MYLQWSCCMDNIPLEVANVFLFLLLLDGSSRKDLGDKAIAELAYWDCCCAVYMQARCPPRHQPATAIALWPGGHETTLPINIEGGHLDKQGTAKQLWQWHVFGLWLPIRMSWITRTDRCWHTCDKSPPMQLLQDKRRPTSIFMRTVLLT